VKLYVVKRLAVTAFLALAASLVIFLIAHLVPGNPVDAVLGDKAASNPAIVAAYRARWHLDDPIWVQYAVFLEGLTHGDLGVSIQSQRPVLTDIGQYAPATIELATAAMLLAVLVGVPLGVIAAVRRDSWIDNLARLISLAGVSLPTFWLAFIVLALFYGGLQIAPGPGRLGVTDLPPPTVTGSFVVDAILAGQFAKLGSIISHMVLPSIVLSAVNMAVITRTTRAAMLETLEQDYIRTARAKGLRERSVIYGHAFRNALLPVVTLGGVAYAQLLAGAVMTETVFSWPGLGRYAYQAAVSLDFPAITGVALVVAVVYLLINLVVDLSYTLLDPRAVRR
jgi:ABC-type dipeptide/oligopeptide/nickel transport systems, permease components